MIAKCLVCKKIIEISAVDKRICPEHRWCAYRKEARPEGSGYIAAQRMQQEVLAL